MEGITRTIPSTSVTIKQKKLKGNATPELITKNYLFIKARNIALEQQK